MTLPRLLRSEGWTGRFLGLAFGAVAVLGHAPFHLWPLTLISLAFLFGRIQAAATIELSRRAAFSVGFWWALGYFAAGIYWIGAAFIERGPAFIPLMPFMVGGLACLLAVFWGVAGAYLVRSRFSGFAAVLSFMAAFTLAELARGHLFGGLPWNLPAYIFEAGSAPSQMARWVNAYGLSAIVLLVSAALGQVIFWRKGIWPILLATLPMIGLYLIGYVRLSGATVETVPDVKIRIVSVPFKQSEKLNPSTSVEIVNAFIRESVAPGIEDITHLVWPEGAVNGLALENEALLRAVGQSLVSVDDTPPVWLMNSLVAQMDDGRLRYYNASVAITFDAVGNPTIAATNLKQKLVPFGEHIPFMDWMEDVQVPLISTNLASISPAKEKNLANFPGLPRLSPQICYEIIFPGFTPVRSGEPPQLILNQSNDAWFGRRVGPAQHANIARYRAIESGLPIIRAASNGVSGVIDSYGRIQKNINSHEAFYLDKTLGRHLKYNTKTRIVTFLLVLINLLACFIMRFMKRNFSKQFKTTA